MIDTTRLARMDPADNPDFHLLMRDRTEVEREETEKLEAMWAAEPAPEPLAVPRSNPLVTAVVLAVGHLAIAGLIVAVIL